MKNSLPHTSFLADFIAELRSLYARLSVYVLHARMDRYSKNQQRNTAHTTPEIRNSLSQCVDKIIHHVRNEAKPLHIVIPPQLVTTPPHATESAPTVNQHQIDHEHINALSQYFRARNSSSELHPGLKDKLMHSAWDHIYEAIRHANHANKRGANIHIEIANHAVKELAHYMQPEEYKGFVTEVVTHLNELHKIS